MNKKIIKPTPFGSVCLIWRGSTNMPRIVYVLLPRPGLPVEVQTSALFPDSRTYSCPKIDAVALSIKAYLEGEDIKFPLNIVDLSLCSKFQQSVLRAEHAIPRGRVSTYGLIAAHLGIPGGARAVGNALAGNPYPLIVPCHRAILSNYHLGGFQGGVEMKKALLKNEGIIFDKAGRVICRQLHYS
ncbi:MAG TPA: methylated-DNA--[protein]-cysteine S-methyltransferase [Smithella sp.]|nr:methylated-DNA--[protein]-cysteine S-methyltransferase [Smithella sp.]